MTEGQVNEAEGAFVDYIVVAGMLFLFYFLYAVLHDAMKSRRLGCKPEVYNPSNTPRTPDQCS